MSAKTDAGLKSARDWVYFFTGMGATAVSLSSGSIWASQDQAYLVFPTALLAWSGYLLAHYAATGRFVDDRVLTDVQSERDGSTRNDIFAHPFAFFEESVPGSRVRSVIMVLGVGTLIMGMVIGSFYVRQENHLMTNVGGVLFVGGYVLAHWADRGTLL